MEKLKRPVVLAFAPFYLPGYRGGGPIRSMANMVQSLKGDFDFRIVTIDRDLGDEGPYDGVQVDSWNDVGGAKVFYASPAALSFSGFVRVLRETSYDLLYLNSCFHPRFTLLPLLINKFGDLRRPVVVAPRGELSSGALGIKKLKKRVFIGLSRSTGFYDDVYWQASAEHEKDDIFREFGSKALKIRVVKNVLAPFVGVQGDRFAEKAAVGDKSNRVLRVCFLSRIAKMKNLDFALNVFMRVKATVVFNIFGPMEDREYWNSCQSLIKRLPENIKVEYCGGVGNSDVVDTIARHDLFFVPTQGENFGHVFLESLSAGVPVLVSDATPWRGLEEKGLGWDIPLDKIERFVSVIEEAASFSDSDFSAYRLMCSEYARKIADDSDTVELYRQFFNELISHTT